MSDRAGKAYGTFRRKVWSHTDAILSVVTLSFILTSWALDLFGNNTLLASTIVAAIGASALSLSNALSSGIELVRADIKDRLPARVCGHRPDMAKAVSNASQLIQIISYAELAGADKSRRQFYSALKASARSVPHQRIVWNYDHVLWIRQNLEHLNTSDMLELYAYLPKIGTSVTTFDLIDSSSIIFAQNWESGRHLHLDGADVARHFRVYFERMMSSSTSIKRRGTPIDLRALDAFEASLTRQRSNP